MFLIGFEVPCSPPEADRESSKCKEEIPFHCSSLANPAASCGECARCSIFDTENNSLSKGLTLKGGLSINSNLEKSKVNRKIYCFTRFSKNP